MPNVLGVPGQNPLRYAGPFGMDVIPIKKFPRIPLTTDKKYPLGQFAIIDKDPSTGAEGDLYYLSSFTSGNANWRFIGAGGGSGIDGIVTDDGLPAVVADANNDISIVGGAGINVNGNGPGTIVTITATPDVPTTFTGNVGSATPVANNLNVLGGSGVNVAGSGDTLTLTFMAATAPTVPTTFQTDSGNAIPSSNILKIFGTGNITTSGATDTVTISFTGVLPQANGGTSFSSYTAGDIIYANGVGTLTKLPIGSANQTLSVSGGLPSWQNNGNGNVTTTAIADNVLVRGDGGTTGIQGSGVTLDDSNNATGFAAIQATSISFDGGSNLLNNYTNATYTPVITGGVSDPTVTYSFQMGRYTRIGKRVFVDTRISINTISGGSGEVRISLPYTAVNASNYFAMGSTVLSGGPSWTGDYLCSQVRLNEAFMEFVIMINNAGNGALMISNLANGDVIGGSISYEVA